MIPLLVLLPLLATGSAPRPGALSVRASATVAPCVEAAATLFERTSGRPVFVQTARIGAVSSAHGADVVVGVEEELTRVIEGGASDPGLDVDVATIPWVLQGAGAVADVRSLAAGGKSVRVPGGVIARHARQSLETLPPARVRTEASSDAFQRLQADEVALVPLSLASPASVTATSIQPLSARALGVRGTPRPDAARAFVEFLAAGPGNAAFRACGRSDAR